MTRQDALRVMTKHIKPCVVGREFNEAIDMAIEALADRPTGKWIIVERGSNENGFTKWNELKCPVCGHEPVFEDIDDMNFCPNCGADMRGGGND